MNMISNMRKDMQQTKTDLVGFGLKKYTESPIQYKLL